MIALGHVVVSLSTCRPGHTHDGRARACPRARGAAARHDRVGGTGLDVTTMDEVLAYAIAPGGFAYNAGVGGLERSAATNGAIPPLVASHASRSRSAPR
jgi:hypothetical protein